MEGKTYPTEAENDILISAAISHLEAVHETLQEFQITAPSRPSLEFRSLPRDKYDGYFMYLRRVYYSGEFSSTLDTLEYYVRKLIPQTHFGRIITLFLLIHSEYLQFLSPYNTKYYKMDLNHRIKFLSIIITTTPRTDMGKWDQIAMEMNQYLHERNTRSRGTRDSFFDGKQCLDFFQKEFEPLVSDKTPTTFFKRILQPLFPGQLLPYYDLECIAADALGVYQSNSESASILSKLFNISSSLLTVTLMLRNIYINYRRLSMT